MWTAKKAKRLRDRGVEVVKGDVNEVDPGRFFKNAYATFLVTNFWDPSCKEKEEEQGKRLVDAAHKAGVQCLIWSSLPNVDQISKGKYHVPHFAQKARVEEYIKGLQNSSKPAFKYASFFGPGFYYQNFLTFFPPAKDGDNLVFTIPETSNLSLFDVRDSGAVVSAMLRDPTGTNGKFISACTFTDSPQKIVEIIKKSCGQGGDKIKLNLVKREDYAHCGREGAEEMAEMFGWFDEFTYYGKIDKNGAQNLGVSLKRFDEWVATDMKLKFSSLE